MIWTKQMKRSVWFLGDGCGSSHINFIYGTFLGFHDRLHMGPWKSKCEREHLRRRFIEGTHFKILFLSIFATMQAVSDIVNVWILLIFTFIFFVGVHTGFLSSMGNASTWFNIWRSFNATHFRDSCRSTLLLSNCASSFCWWQLHFQDSSIGVSFFSSFFFFFNNFIENFSVLVSILTNTLIFKLLRVVSV